MSDLTERCGCDGEGRCVNHRYIAGRWQIRLQSAEYDQSTDYWKEVYAQYRLDAEAKALADEPNDAYVCEVIPPQKPDYDSGYDSGLALL